MQYPQVLVLENDGRLAEMLRREKQAGECDWLVREPRRLEAVLRLLDRPGKQVLVIKLGHDLVRELTLLERVRSLYPETRCVIVGDADHPALVALAWDLGADIFLFPPLPRHQLSRVVAGFLAGGESERAV